MIYFLCIFKKKHIVLHWHQSPIPKSIQSKHTTSADALIALHLQGFVQEVYLEYQKRDRPYQLRLYDPKKIFEQIQVLCAQDKRFRKKQHQTTCKV